MAALLLGKQGGINGFWEVFRAVYRLSRSDREWGTVPEDQSPQGKSTITLDFVEGAGDN